jgi:hypothetical protein
MDKFDYAVKRIKGEWPANPRWIYTTPDKGKTLYRSMRGDVCPECFKDSNGQAPRQLYKVDNKVVAHDEDYGTQEIGTW